MHFSTFLCHVHALPYEPLPENYPYLSASGEKNPYRTSLVVTVKYKLSNLPQTVHV